MRPMMVVVAPPTRGERLSGPHVLEDLGVEQLAPQPAVKTLRITILPRRPRLDVQRLDACSREEPADRSGDELRAVVAANALRHAANHEQPLFAGASGSVVSPEGLLQDCLVELRLGQQLLQPLVLLIEFLQPLGFFGLHPAILIPPTAERLLADLQGLARLADRLARCDHPVRFTQLLDDLLRGMLLAFHRESPCRPNGP